MDVGLLLYFQNFRDSTPDRRLIENEMRLADLAEPLGFDMIAVVEHHFFNYSMCPDNLQVLAYMAARTQRIKLLTAAVILPWNDPVRVAERMILLDHLSNGRALFGIGRGLAKREYDRFGIDMNESRERFDEAAELIVRGLETGVIEGNGPFYKRMRAELRPRPYASFKDRFYCVAMSSDSVPVCARLGARCVTFIMKPWDQMRTHFDTHRRLFLEHHKRPAPPAVCVIAVVCDESAEQAQALAYEQMGNVFLNTLEHYDLAGDTLKNVKGYGDYAKNADAMRGVTPSEGGKAFADVNIWGTPQQVLDKFDRLRRDIGDLDVIVEFSYGSMPLDKAERGMRLFASKVLPEIKSWKRAA